MLRKILATHKTQFPPVGAGWIFRGEKLHKPLDLDNRSPRDIPQFVKWHGWQAFRGGPGTCLFDMGVRDVEVQKILRLADVSTTLAHYVKLSEESTRETKRRFAKAVRRKYGIK